jgi:hypothetical protein
MLKNWLHDNLIRDADRDAYHAHYREMAKAVSKCLEMYLGAFEKVRAKWYATPSDIYFSPIVLMMDFAEAIDGVSILVAAGSSRNCPQLLRTALELQLAIKYMVGDEKELERRSLAYEFFHLHSEHRLALRFDSSSATGRQLRSELTGDQFAGVFDKPPINVKKEITSAESNMQSPRYDPVRAEIARMKATDIKAEHWYSLWGGPRNVRSLAIRLKRGSLYETLYRSFSGLAHGGASINRANRLRGKIPRFDPLRSPKGLPTMCVHAGHICNSLTLTLAELVPEIRPQLKLEYVHDVKPWLDYLNSPEIRRLNE